MANNAVTLTSGAVSTITVDGDHEEIEVVQLAGTPVAVYYTVGFCGRVGAAARGLRACCVADRDGGLTDGVCD